MQSLQVTPAHQGVGQPCRQRLRSAGLSSNIVLPPMTQGMLRGMKGHLPVAPTVPCPVPGLLFMATSAESQYQPQQQHLPQLLAIMDGNPNEKSESPPSADSELDGWVAVAATESVWVDSTC